jgi:uncharacterized protein (DUF736 family)
MAEQNNDNTLVLFPNEYKTTDKQPDYKGKATIDGKNYKCAGWKQTGRNTGKPYLSVKFTPDEEAAFAAAAPAVPKRRPRNDDDEIPF